MSTISGKFYTTLCDEYIYYQVRLTVPCDSTLDPNHIPPLSVWDRMVWLTALEQLPCIILLKPVGLVWTCACKL